MLLDNLSNNNQYLQITDYPALNQKALDSVSCSDTLSIGVAEDKKNTLLEIMQACREKYLSECPKYNRKQACLLIGFPGKTRAFTQWLRGNNFLSSDDYPEYSLIERGLMAVHQKDIYREVKYDCCSQPISGNEYEGATRIKSVYTPLVTVKGISFFKALLANETKLKQEVEEIKLLNKPHTNYV